MEQANHLDVLADLAIHHEMTRAGDASHGRADFIPTCTEMERTQAAREVGTFA